MTVQEREEQKQYARYILEDLLDIYGAEYILREIEKLREELLSR